MTMQIGNIAPDFTLSCDNDAEFTLSAHKDQNVVLYFYPKDDTPGCTQEAKDFTRLLPEFQQLNTIIVGISKDSINSHKNFKNKYSINFHLLSDEGVRVIEMYGAWVEKSMFGKKYMGIERSTFLISINNIILQIWRKVKVNHHAEQVLNSIRSNQ